MNSSVAFVDLADLASARVGGRAVAASDDFFASKTNLLKPAPAVFVADKFTARGKWMDGWESRRKRTPGHDWCVVALGLRGRIRGVDVDTSFFNGNQPVTCTIEAFDAATASPRGPLGRRQLASDGAPWIRIVGQSPLSPSSHQLIAVDDERPWTHVRLNIFPDGGVARFRVYGDPEIDWSGVRRAGRAIDLAALVNGGLVLAASDMHFGAKDNLIMPGRAKNMGDGWETRRRRGPGHDWVMVRLGAAGTIQRVEIDTNHFKGNFPESASLETCLVPGASLTELYAADWREMLPRTRLRAHHRHFFSRELARVGAASHVRLNIYPDGGISRLRVHGTVQPA